MKRIVFQLIIVMVAASLCVGGFFFVQRIFQIPFRSANDALHKKGTALNLDFLIPAGIHIDDKITIGQLVKIRVAQKSSPYEAAVRSVSDLIPPKYILLGNFLLFFFWSFCVLILIRLFTFVGYGRALRTSLLLGGVIYYFMPDFSPYGWEDVIFVAGPSVGDFSEILLDSRRKEAFIRIDRRIQNFLRRDLMDYKRLFEPESMVVVGVSLHNDRNPANIIYRKNRLRYPIRVFAVNPNGGVIQGDRVYERLADIPEKVDLAVIAVRADLVPDTLAQCISAGVGGAVVISGGFAEVGRQDLQDRLVDLADKSGFSLCGSQLPRHLFARTGGYFFFYRRSGPCGLIRAMWRWSARVGVSW